MIKNPCTTDTRPESQSWLKIQPLRKQSYKKYAESILGKNMKDIKENINKYMLLWI